MNSKKQKSRSWKCIYFRFISNSSNYSFIKFSFYFDFFHCFLWRIGSKRKRQIKKAYTFSYYRFFNPDGCPCSWIIKLFLLQEIYIFRFIRENRNYFYIFIVSYFCCFSLFFLIILLGTRKVHSRSPVVGKGILCRIIYLKNKYIPKSRWWCDNYCFKIPLTLIWVITHIYNALNVSLYHPT